MLRPLLSALMSAFAICRHTRTTFPQSSRSGSGAHVTCLQCGHEMAYDWALMKIVKRHRVLLRIKYKNA